MWYSFSAKGKQNQTKKNSQTSPSTAGVTAFSDERERTGWRKVFAALQYE